MVTKVIPNKKAEIRKQRKKAIKMQNKIKGLSMAEAMKRVENASEEH